jgi:hypothetical protein
VPYFEGLYREYLRKIWARGSATDDRLDMPVSSIIRSA